MTLVVHFRAWNTERFSQPDPHLDSARARIGAVVVHDALDPQATNVGVRTVRENGGVFPWNRALIRETIRHPPLKLPLREPAFVHQLVKGVTGVIRAAE